MIKTAMLLSGGVDSSVALYELLKTGKYDVTAFYLKIWLEDELNYLGSCPWEEDLEYVRKICEQAGVPLQVISLQQEYFDRVVNYAIEELKAGRTPSPDVYCNLNIKFGAFYDRIDNSYEKIASGHYAVIEECEDGVRMKRSPDPIKDQSYFLSYMTQDQLQRALFPIGGYMKEQVRELAEGLDLPNKDRKDSQGICFLGKIKYPDFVKHYLGTRDGEIRELETDEVLGTHNGFWFHTIGQRQGLGLSNGPWYVVKKDTWKNIVYVSKNKSELEKNSNELTITKINWQYIKPEVSHVGVKLRHGPNIIPADIEYLSDGRVHIVLQQGDRGIAPGQIAVLYDGEICLGAGTIE